MILNFDKNNINLNLIIQKYLIWYKSMYLQKSLTRLNEMICDQLVFQKLQTLEENEIVNLNMFPYRTK